MKAIVATDRAAEAAGTTLAERPEPTPAINDVVVEVHASGFVPAEWEWPSTWVDRSGHDRAQPIIGHELAGVVTSLGYGTTGLSLGQRVFGITDWHRDGTLAQYAAVEARNLSPLPGNLDFTMGASLPISGLTAWQGLFQHGRLQAGQTVLAHGAAGAVGSVVTQLAAEFGAYVIGTGRVADRQAVLDFGANEFLNLDDEDLKTSARSTWSSTSSAVTSKSDRRASSGLAERWCQWSGPLRLALSTASRSTSSSSPFRVNWWRSSTGCGTGASARTLEPSRALDDAVPALSPTKRRKGKTVIRVRP